MNTPKIDAALRSHATSAAQEEKFHKALSELETAISNKQIWNTDYENAKYWVGRGAEIALGVAVEPWREELRAKNFSWSPGDARHDMSSYLSPLQANGLLKRLQKYKNEPAVLPYVEVLTEVAQIGDLLKQIKPFIVKGRKPNPNAVAPDLSNTGQCPICLRRQKLTINSTMVDHGYTIPQGWGGRNGHCLGFKHKPYELSNEGNIFYKEILEQQRDRNLVVLGKLRNNEYPELTNTRKVRKGTAIETIVDRYPLGDPGYDVVRDRQIQNTEYENRMLSADIEVQEQLIRDWKLQPLAYGGPETQKRWEGKIPK